jgi:biopolymer transport protein ExbD
VKTVEISATGVFMLDKRKMSLDEIEQNLKQANKMNPNLVVYIRADENGKNKELYAVIDRCQRNGITRFSLRTQPIGTR